MSLTSGTRLGAYEILALIGAGGMGEVYKARDTRLERTVAIKVLPPPLAADPQFRDRFDREAKAISALDHPHICALYDVGEQDGTSFLVMQYLEGETLATRLEKGALPIEQALGCAIEIASALDTAHRHGITHRDLKPGNIFLCSRSPTSPRPTAFAEGAGRGRSAHESVNAKLLDFGLAKHVSGAAGRAREAHLIGGVRREADLSAAPTRTAPLTAQGMILGTFQYMAPEQLEGHEADSRTDLFAFGAVLYEMLTGKKAFEGKSQASLIGAILKDDPPSIAASQPLTPPTLDHIVRRCLAKEPDERWQSASDLYRELRWVAETGSQVGVATPTERGDTPRALWRRVGMPAGAVLAAAVVAGTGVWFATRTASPVPRVSRLEIAPPSAASLTLSGATGDIAITPDGTRIVYTGANTTALFVRPLDQLDATPLAGLGAPIGPFVSPDGQWIGFVDAGNLRLKKVAITGGPAVTLTGLDSVFRGATWTPDGTIVFATANTTTGLLRIPAGGGESTVMTHPNRARGEADHLWPKVLPGGQAVLFTITATGGLDQAQVALLDLRTGTQTTLIQGGSDAHYVPSEAPNAAAVPGTPSGYLVYGTAGTLRAVAFDRARLAIIGTPVPVVPQVVTTNAGGVDVAVARDGTFVYVPGRATAAQQRTLVWVDRQGQETLIPAAPRAYDQPRISPDGTRLALHGNDQELDLWLWDLLRGALARLTADPANDLYPVWSPDSGRLLFSSERVAGRNLFVQAADRTGAVTQLTESPNQQSATSLSPDGTRLVFTETGSKTGTDVMQLRLDGAHQITALVQTPFTERNGEISPDGRWLAYEANDSGPFEIYVRPFPAVAGGLWQVSTGGGRQPLWARNSVELFYLSPTGALMRVGVARGATWVATAPAKLLDGRYYTGTGAQVGRNYDIAPDGRRFLMVKPGGSESTPAPTNLIVVQHFDEELKRLVGGM